MGGGEGERGRVNEIQNRKNNSNDGGRWEMDANRMFNPTGRRAVQRCDSHSSLLLLDVLLPMHHECSSINKGEEDREIGQGLHIQQSTGDSGNRKGKCGLGNWRCIGIVLLFSIYL
jgi:hypothetical protein